MSAIRALAGGVPGIDVDHRDSFSLGFVCRELLQLEERPGTEDVPLTLSKPYPLPDTFEVFKDYRGTGAFSVCYDLLADAMVYVFGEVRLFASTFTQESLRGVCSFLLEFTAKGCVTSALALDGASRKRLALACYGDCYDSQIYPETFGWLRLGRLRDVANLMDIEITVTKDQIRFALPGFQCFKLLGTGKKWNLESTVHRPDGNDPVFEFPGEDSRIVRNASELPKFSFCFLVQFVGVRDLGDNPNGDLCGELELLAHCIVANLVNVVLLEVLIAPHVGTEIVCGIIHRLKREAQRVVLFLCGIEFYLGNQLQTFSLIFKS